MMRIAKKPEVRKKEIVKAARYLIQTKSFDQTTVQDIAHHLSIANGTIYYHFPSKENLLEAVIVDIVDEGVERMQRMISESDGDALEKIRLLISSGTLTENTDEILEQLHRPGNYGMYVRVIVATLQKQAPIFAKLVQQGCEEGLFQTEAPLETTEFILAATQVLLDQGIYPWKQEELTRRVLAFRSLVDTLLKAKPGTFQFLFENLLGSGELK